MTRDGCLLDDRRLVVLVEGLVGLHAADDARWRPHCPTALAGHIIADEVSPAAGTVVLYDADAAG